MRKNTLASICTLGLLPSLALAGACTDDTISVYGYGQYTSYWYPGGLNLELIPQ